MVASARQRGVRLGEKPAVPRISDLGHLYVVVARQAGARHDGQPSDVASGRCSTPILAEAIKTVFEEYVDKHGLDEIAEIFGKGVKIEVGDMLPSSALRRAAQARAARRGRRRSR